MSRKLKALVCVAHPDDETIFFGGLIATKKYDWTVVCVTDANADGLGKERMGQFKKACHLLGVKKIIFLNYPDLFDQRLNTEKLIQDFNNINSQEFYKYIFTHGILGEYGHKHHQDVSYATHKVFQRQKIFSVAYNLYPELSVGLSQKIYNLKTKLLSKIYAGESMRFLGFLPATSSEGFVALKYKEVEEIYSFIVGQKKLITSNLKAYRWLAHFIENRDFELKTRPF